MMQYTTPEYVEQALIISNQALDALGWSRTCLKVIKTPKTVKFNPNGYACMYMLLGSRYLVRVDREPRIDPHYALKFRLIDYSLNGSAPISRSLSFQKAEAIFNATSLDKRWVSYDSLLGPLEEAISDSVKHVYSIVQTKHVPPVCLGAQLSAITHSSNRQLYVDFIASLLRHKIVTQQDIIQALIAPANTALNCLNMCGVAKIVHPKHNNLVLSRNTDG
jgi:hypothetical protein